MTGAAGAMEQSTAMQSSSGAGVALVFQAGTVRVPVAVDIEDLCPVLEFTVRPWGEPRRCSECGKPVTTDTPACGGALGTVQCQRHQPRALLHGEPDDLHPPVMSWMPRVVSAAPPPCPECGNARHWERVSIDSLYAACGTCGRLGAFDNLDSSLAEPPVRPSGTPSMSLRERLAARRAAERTQA